MTESRPHIMLLRRNLLSHSRAARVARLPDVHKLTFRVLHSYQGTTLKTSSVTGPAIMTFLSEHHQA